MSFRPHFEQTLMTAHLVQTVVRIHEGIDALAEFVSVQRGHPARVHVHGLKHDVIGIADRPKNYPAVVS